MAHTIGKSAIIISHKINDIPYDIRHLRTIIYDYTPRGMKIFESALETTLEHELNHGNASPVIG